MLKIYKNLINPEDNTLIVIYSLLKTINVDVTKTSLKKRLEEHPQYPSLLSVSDILNHYKVVNQTVRLSIERLKTFEQPFLALLRSEDSHTEYYCLIKSSSKDGVIILNSKTGKENKYAWIDFEKIYQSIVLIAEGDEKSGDRDFKKQQWIERKEGLIMNLLFLFAPVLTLSIGFYNFHTTGIEKNIFPLIYSLLSLSGGLVAILLFWFDVDNSNSVLLEVCGGKDNNDSFDCGAVLKSKASSFLSVSWSVWGTTYFLSLLFGQLLNGFSDKDTLQYLTLFSIIASLYVPFSIYYQWKVVKHWCRFCLIVQFILFSQSSIVIFSANFNHTLLLHSIRLSWHVGATFAIIGILCFLLANQIFNNLKVGKSDKSKLKELMKVKFDPIVFDAILKRQKAITESTESLGILLGNPNSKNKIIKVCNPYCEPCAKVHPIITSLLENIDDLEIQILFTVSNNDNDRRNEPVKHFLAIHEANDEALTKDCLDDWYNVPEKNYDLFAEKYKINEDLSKQAEKVDKMHQWCRKMNIQFTPTIFLNGYQLPETYQITDVEYFLKS